MNIRLNLKLLILFLFSLSLALLLWLKHENLINIHEGWGLNFPENPNLENTETEIGKENLFEERLSITSRTEQQDLIERRTCNKVNDLVFIKTHKVSF